MDAKELLADTSTFAYRKVAQVPADQLYLLSMHPRASVRAAALRRGPHQSAPCFISDTNPDVNAEIARILMLP